MYMGNYVYITIYIYTQFSIYNYPSPYPSLLARPPSAARRSPPPSPWRSLAL